jgi:hypothetical protein
MALGKIKADTLEHSTAGSLDTQYVVNGSAKAWVNFNGTGTIATQDSFNHSSLTDHDTGKYTNTLASAMSNANYAGNANGGQPGSRDCFALFPSTDANTTTTHRVRTTPSNSPDSNHDASVVMISIHGDLA